MTMEATLPSRFNPSGSVFQRNCKNLYFDNAVFILNNIKKNIVVSSFSLGFIISAKHTPSKEGFF